MLAMATSGQTRSHFPPREKLLIPLVQIAMADKMTSTTTTPEDEIERQHQEAIRQVEACLPYDEPQCQEELPIAYKRCLLQKQKEKRQLSMSTRLNEHQTDLEHSVDEDYSPGDSFDNEEEDDQINFPCWSSRGHVDVSAIQTLVREGYNLSYPPLTSPASSSSSSCSEEKKSQSDEVRPVSLTNLWDPANAAVQNVKICRPSHDQWGILKIVMVFCDDFCQRVLELPWWHARDDFRNAIQPILNVLEIEQNRVVRLLLASLPPGVTIPIHQDSGEWVKQTHRVHCPILVKHPSHIMFQVGNVSRKHLQRIECSPGHVFEINNQGWHFVSNCDPDHHRVHLILDYLDKNHTLPQVPPRFQLKPGEVVWQTRRSVDRHVEKGQRPTPSYLILGVQKAGTTSLYNYMIQHPLVIPARRRETHALDWRWNEKCKTVQQERKWCHQAYYTAELERHPSCLTGDSTPSYLLDSKRVLPRIKRVFDWPLKFFVMLRDPVKRVESHYAMVTSNEGTPAQLKARGTEWRDLTIDQVIQQDLEKMRKCGLIPYFDIETGIVDQSAFQAFSNSQQENAAWEKYLTDIPLHTGSHCLIGRGLYELNLRPWLKQYDQSDFLVIRLETMKDHVQTTMDRVWQHLGIPQYDLEDDTAKNTRVYDPILTTERRDFLRRFYKPHNERLADVLGEEWRSAW